MKQFTKEELQKFYTARKDKLVDYMEQNSITAVVFEDCEERRNPAVRYFTGHPTDAIYVIALADEENENEKKYKDFLIPWDENLANEKAVDVQIIPYNKYERKNIIAVAKVLKTLKIKSTKKIELPPETPYPLFLKYVDALSKDNWDVLCHEKSVHDFVVDMRSTKDRYEIECTKEACRVGDHIISEIERGIRENWLHKEMDVALLIESELRKCGCEKTGFDTLAAGPSRSWAIHAFPGYTNADWPADGLSILDFGVVYEGYTSDTTLTIAKNLNEKQEELVQLVEKAAKEALPLYKPNSQIKLAGAKATEIFAKAKKIMPHTLGHGIGLEIHEFPRVSDKQEENVVFKPGMIITLEPGLYDPKLGGVRLENDVLITENGNEVLTHSKIIRI